MSAIHTEKLSKRYGATLALDRLDLTVNEGEVYGYLGPNGAGKTTTIRLLLGLHRPSAGRAALFGVDAWSDPVTAHRRVAYVAGEPFLWPSLTSAETFEFLARLHGATDVAYRDQLVDRFRLDTGKKIRALSKGNRQKVQLIAAGVEEEAGRMEFVLAGLVGRRTAYLASLAAITGAVVILGLAEFAGLAVAGLPAGGAAYLALATASVVLVFVGVGAVASQLAPTRRKALEIGGAVVVLFLLLRVIADTSSGVGWLRWATPLGWAENLRPFSGAHPVVLLLAVVATTLLVVAAERIAAGRDIGTGMLPARDTADPRLRLLSSPTAQALRGERGSLIVWLTGVGAFAYIIGVTANSTSSAGISKSLQRELAKLGSGSIVTPSGYLAFTFIFFVLAVSLFTCAQIAAARHVEADQQIEALLAQPVGRVRWLGGRLLLAAAAAAGLSLASGLLSWAGAESGGASLSLARILEAGANCLPVALLFLGIAALAYAVAPQASAGIAYGLVTIGFLWQLFGSLFGAPKWLVELTPFAHVGLVPAEPFRAGAAAVMVGIGLVVAVVALGVFRRRDLLGA